MIRRCRHGVLGRCDPCRQAAHDQIVARFRALFAARQNRRRI